MIYYEAQTAYGAADEAYKIAYWTHDAMAKAYRAGTVTDEMFLASKAAFDAALVAVDAAMAVLKDARDARPLGWRP